MHQLKTFQQNQVFDQKFKSFRPKFKLFRPKFNAPPPRKKQETPNLRSLEEKTKIRRFSFSAKISEGTDRTEFFSESVEIFFVPVMKSFSSVFSRVSDRPVEKPPDVTGSFKLNKAENVSQFAKVAFPSKSSHQLWLSCEQALAYLRTFIQCQVSQRSCSTAVERPSKVVDNSATLLTLVWTPAAA